MADFIKSDNWVKALKAFAKAVGTVDYQKTEKRFDSVTEHIRIMDDGIKFYLSKIKEKDQESIKQTKTNLENKLKLFNKECDELIVDLKKVLPKQIEAIEKLDAELDMYSMLWGRIAIRLKTEELDGSRSESEAFKLLREKIKKTKSLDKGVLKEALEGAEKKIDIVKLALQNFKNLGITLEELVAIYNKELPSNSSGVRMVTTRLGAFADLEQIFEIYSKLKSDSLKKVGVHDRIKTYKEFREYLTAASFFIRKLSPWADTTGLIDKQIFNDKSQTEVIKDIATRLGELKVLLNKLERVFEKLL